MTGTKTAQPNAAGLPVLEGLLVIILVSGVALLKAARAGALLAERDYVIPDDVKGMAPAVLRHRVSVAPELELEGVTPDAALQAVLDKTEVPTT